MLKPGKISATANAAQGLFYGVETLVQLLKPRGGRWMLTEGEITDWPDLGLRAIYWCDEAHGRVRMATTERLHTVPVLLVGSFS